MNQPLNAEIDKCMKRVPEPEPEEGVIGCSEKLHAAAEAFTKHRTSEVHWKQRAEAAGGHEQWEVVGEWAHRRLCAVSAQSRSWSALLPLRVGDCSGRSIRSSSGHQEKWP